MKNSSHVQVCNSAAYNEPFRNHNFNHREDSLMLARTHGMPKHVEGDFVRLLCMCSSACKFACIVCLVCKGSGMFQNKVITCNLFYFCNCVVNI
jgi:hypothetical protein